MRLVLRSLVAAGVLATLAGCDSPGPTPVLSLSEARAGVMTIAQQGSTQAFCSDEGRRNFRLAVRAYSAALEKSGQAMSIAPTQIDTDQVWVLVSMGVFARVLEPSDLPGPMQVFAAMLSMPGATMPQLGNTRDAMAKACPELVDVYRAGTRLARIEQRTTRAHADHDSERDLRELDQDRAEQAERVQAAVRRLELKMRNSGWDPRSLDPTHNLPGHHS